MTVHEQPQSQYLLPLHTLGWKAFQDLCVTIAAEVLGQTVQSFLPYNDAGRDGAFYGHWQPTNGERWEGPFTIQCKHTSKPQRLLRPSDLEEEIVKAKHLAAAGLADIYLLLTNYEVSARTEAVIRERFLVLPGLNHFQVLGADWLTRQIQQSPKLRMLVPRVYGLGDLGEILDERALEQARDILSLLGDELAKFVVTNAYRTAATALAEKNFVLLLGQPASGKSLIGASLAMAALDRWECATFKIRNPDEFVAHWNPHQPRRFFWVDDAFGPTQCQLSLVSSWNQCLFHLRAATRKGARVLFTSRDYVFRNARRFLKVTDFPLFEDSQVIIDVEALSQVERAQILYNHLRLGKQPNEFRSAVKPFLREVADHSKFLPEVARRLGDPLFTKRLPVTRTSVLDFVDRPVSFLVEVLRTLDRGSFAAISLVFLSGACLPSPVVLGRREEQALASLGSSLSEVKPRFRELDGSLLKHVFDRGRGFWTFKHPTIGDAFAHLVADDPELLDIYLMGAPLTRLLEEVVCGDIDLQGATVRVPAFRSAMLISRLAESPRSQEVYRFLSYRCDRTFLERYLNWDSNLLESIAEPGAYLHAFYEVNLLARLHEFSFLPEEYRQRFVATVARHAIEVPDADFLWLDRIRCLLREEEIADILETAERELFPNWTSLIYDWKLDRPYDEEPENFFGTLRGAIEAFRDECTRRGRDTSTFTAALQKIEEIIAEESAKESDDSLSDMKTIGTGLTAESEGPRDIFDDVDTG